MKKLSAILGVAGLALLLVSVGPWPQAGSGTEQGGAAEATPAARASGSERGMALFRDKGCAMCHRNDRLEGKTGIFGTFAPDLTSYRNDPALLRGWLANPEAQRPGTEMPDLDLAPQEIEDLIAFLTPSPAE
jgi:cytochrome c2